MKREELETLAHAPKKIDNVEDEIPLIEDSIKQSDVMDHLKKVDVNQEAG
jgi:hypothetical protein